MSAVILSSLKYRLTDEVRIEHRGSGNALADGQTTDRTESKSEVPRLQHAICPCDIHWWPDVLRARCVANTHALGRMLARGKTPAVRTSFTRLCERREGVGGGGVAKRFVLWTSWMQW